MLAVIARAAGGLENLALEARAEPDAPGSGEVLVELAAAGFNFADLIALQGFYQDRQEFPFVMGLEGAGTVIAAGENVAPAIVDSRVHRDLERHVCAALVVPVDASSRCRRTWTSQPPPASRSPMARRTARSPGKAVSRPARLLVLGAAGGVGLTAVEVGKAMGADGDRGGRRSREARDRARARRRSCDRLSQRDVASALKEICEGAARTWCSIRSAATRSIRCCASDRGAAAS